MGAHQIVSTPIYILLVSLSLAYCITTGAGQQETSTSTSELKLTCSGNNSVDPRFKYDLQIGVLALQTSSSYQLFNYTSRVFNFTPVVYLSYFCRGDLNYTRCHDCVSLASQAALLTCGTNRTQAVVWREVCTFRYSDQRIYGIPDESRFFVDFRQALNPASVDLARFSDALQEVAGLIFTKLGSTGTGKKFATAVMNVSQERKIYAVGECTWDLYSTDCVQCIHGCVQKLPAGKVGGRVMFPTCNFRYEMHRFYDNNGSSTQDSEVMPRDPLRRDPRAKHPPPSDSPPSSPMAGVGNQPGAMGVKMDPHERKRSHVVQELARFGASLAVLVLVIFGALFCANRRRKNMQASNIEMEEIRNADSLQFELSKIRAATHNFAADKKLGQGGFGQVYKGKLANGQVIAVKRLSRDSSQGIAEFKTEILLVANLQHRNLVKLLGFSFSGKEKILVYEYLSNSSLDRILFDPLKREALNWETRFNIVSGIAKGLLYLHEDSRLKIIHRDLKTSNILLDDFMNPKISDFGMAKLFGVDQTRDATNTIVGTYGYMAPEYMLTGQYSVKSDIYSFGIIVLEMVTGLRNSYMSRPLLEEALLHRAWRLWNEGSGLELVDYVLGEAYSREEVIKCIHIALLCIQEDASRRPNMTWVVAAIRDQTNHFPAPTAPNFFNSIRRSASGSCSSTDPGASSSTARDSMTDLHPR